MIRRSRAVWSGLVWMSLMLLAGAGGRSYANGPTEQDANDLRWDPAGRFAFTWDSIELSSKAMNPDTAEGAGPSVPTRTLDISVKLDILDANNLMALHVAEPEALQLVDEAGAPVRWVPQEPPRRRFYERFKPGYRWTDPRDYILEEGPWGLTVHVELDPNQPLPSLLSAVRGHVYAMYAEDVIEVDVPFAQTASTIIVARIEVFDPNSGWMDVGHDLQIRVLSASMPCNHVGYHTEVRATSGSM